MDEKINSMDNKITHLESKISNVEDNVKKIEADVTTIKADASDLKDGQHRIESKLDEFEAKNASKHLETQDILQGITESLDFLAHKENQTEKEIYTIKKRLQVIK